MKIIILFGVFVLILSANDRCQELYSNANKEWTKLQPILKTEIASRVGWDLINSYIDLASLTISECEPEMKLDFRYIRELKQGMQTADKQREAFKTQTYEQMLNKAINKAKSEGKCTLIYRQYK